MFKMKRWQWAVSGAALGGIIVTAAIVSAALSAERDANRARREGIADLMRDSAAQSERADRMIADSEYDLALLKRVSSGKLSYADYQRLMAQREREREREDIERTRRAVEELERRSRP